MNTNPNGMEHWQPECDRASCTRLYGNMRQLCGLRRSILTDGKARGVEAVDIDTGAGLECTVLPGRGMDICSLRYRGVPISYLSKSGVTAPAYHDARESQWLKSFFAGMLTTCGLTNAGPDCRDDIGLLKDIPFGLHGDISNTAADDVCTQQLWEEGQYRLRVSGRVEEGRLHGEHIEMRRTVQTALGKRSIRIEDTFTNDGELPQQLMFFYHINIGHPVLSESARFIAASRRVWAKSGQAKAGLSTYDLCEAPTSGYLEQQFFHDMIADEYGETLCALVNEPLGLAVWLKYNVRELPCIAQWKVLRDAEYVLAFEPGNCHPIGRKAQQAIGAEILQPMQSRTSHLEIGIADGADEIAALKQDIENRRSAHG